MTTKPSNLISAPEYAMTLVALILVANPLLLQRELADKLGVSERTLHRMRTGRHHFTFPQQLHTESFFQPETVRQLRARHQPKAPTYWQQQLRR